MYGPSQKVGEPKSKLSN